MNIRPRDSKLPTLVDRNHMNAVDDSTKSREQLLAEVEALRARLALLTGGNTLRGIEDQHLQVHTDIDVPGARAVAIERETLSACEDCMYNLENDRLAV